MAYVTNSFVSSNNAELFYRFKELLKTANWKVKKSSDGTTVFSTAGAEDGLTGFGTGAGGMNNNKCWIVLEMPSAMYGYTRQLLIEKRDNDVRYWRVAYSVSGFDLSTGVNASTAPTSTDVREMNSMFNTYGQTYTNMGGGGPFEAGCRVLMAADNASPSGFWVAGVSAIDPTNKSLMKGWLYLDPMATGSYAVPTANNSLTGDVDPYILCGTHYHDQATLNNGFYYANLRTDGNFPSYGWFKYGVSGQAMYPRFRTESLRSTIDYTGLVANPYNGKDVTAPVYWVNNNAGSGLSAYSGNTVPTLGTQAMMVKGVSTLLRLCCQVRANGDTLSVGSGTRDRIVIRDFALPWDGSVPVI